MRPEVDRAVRAGVRIAVIAAAVGLLALLLARVAASAEPDASDSSAEGLLDPGTRTSAERAQTAVKMLEDERRARLGRAAYELLHVGLRASIQASPRRLLGSVRRLGREVWSWRDRSPAEDAALALLEPDVERGAAAGQSAALYESLREREQRALLRDLEQRARSAIKSGDAWRAERYAARLEALGGEPERVARLRESIAALAVRDRERQVAAQEPELRAPDARDAALGALLLSEHDARVIALGGSSPEGRLARAAALHASGQREPAFAELAELAAGEGTVADTARAWLADPQIHPEGELDRLWDQVQVERTLGRVGGERLARDGTQVSRSGYRAWQNSVAPLNLALGVPTRVLSGWQPEAKSFREFAAGYLERFPKGATADETRARLTLLGPAAQERGEWRDGRLVLPPARTAWRRSVEPYLIASGDALGSAAAQQLDDLLLPQGALLLSVTHGAADGALSTADSQKLIAALARGLEQGELRGMGARGGDALEALQRIDAALREGATLVAEPWKWDHGSASDVAKVLLHGGALRAPGDVDVRREDEGIDVDRSLGGGHLRCPLEVTCVDRARRMESALYARIDEDGELRLGAKAGFQGAMLALEVGNSGPRTSLVVPLGYWLGVGRWVPIEAHVELGLDGISVGPRLGDLLPDGSGPAVVK